MYCSAMPVTGAWMISALARMRKSFNRRLQLVQLNDLAVDLRQKAATWPRTSDAGGTRNIGAWPAAGRNGLIIRLLILRSDE
jgi:hypothetical protein